MKKHNAGIKTPGQLRRMKKPRRSSQAPKLAEGWHWRTRIMKEMRQSPEVTKRVVEGLFGLGGGK